MPQHFYLKKTFSEGLNREISILYDLGLDIYEIEFIVNLRKREEDLRLD